MADPILQRRGFQLVPMLKSHVMKFYHDIAPYSAAEYEDVDLFYALDEMQEEQELFSLFAYRLQAINKFACGLCLQNKWIGIGVVLLEYRLTFFGTCIRPTTR